MKFISFWATLCISTVLHSFYPSFANAMEDEKKESSRSLSPTSFQSLMTNIIEGAMPQVAWESDEDRKEYHYIQNEFKKGIDSGNPIEDILYNGGCCYYMGEGVKPNFPKAAWLFNEAAKLDHKDALMMLQNLAESNLPLIEAQYYLGCLYYNGTGVEPNLPKAAWLFNEAAKRDHKDARTRLQELATIHRNEEAISYINLLESQVRPMFDPGKWESC